MGERELDAELVGDGASKMRLRPSEEVSALLGKRQKIIEENSKRPLESYVVPVDGRVTSVTGFMSGPGSYIPITMNTVIGGHNNSIPTPSESRLEIVIDSKTPVKKIMINGSWPIREGDNIRAYVVKANKFHYFGRQTNVYDDCQRSVLVDRDFGETEHAIRIEAIKFGEVVATYHSYLGKDSIKSKNFDEL